MDLRRISDQELLANTKNLVAREREVLLEVLHHLREIERRRLYSDLKQASLFDYCINVLKYSNAQADRRIKAMRAIKELPQIEEKISSGALSLTNVAKAQEFFRQEAKTTVLGSKEKLAVFENLENKSTREAERILLGQSSLPAPEVKERMRQVTTEITEIKFGADEKLLAKFKKLKGLMAHRKPHMNLAEFMDELCEIALNQLELTRKKTKNLPNIIRRAPDVKSSQRQYISVKMKKEVWQKSEGKCANCQSEFALETDHITPVSLGGDSNVENLRLLCRNCNQRAAITKIGEQTMQRFLT
jgi:hypothetical protein